MILVDVHAHLEHKDFSSDIDAVVRRAKDSGVVAIVDNGTDPASNEASLALAARFDIIKPALGMYPEMSSINLAEDAAAQIMANRHRIVAIGEIGLDYSREPSAQDKAAQKKVFLRMIDLALRLDKPMIVHTRKAEADCLDILEEKGAKRVLLHCFMGNLKLARRAEKNGYCLSVPPLIVRSLHFQELVARIDISRLLTETDSPYLSAKKDERNEPMNVIHAITKIAEIKRMDPAEVANVIYMNYQKLF